MNDLRLSRRRGLATAGASAAIALGACGPEGRTGGQSNPAPGAGDKPITILDTFTPVDLDPTSRNTGQHFVKLGIGETLARVSAKGEVEPWLATSWRSLDPLRWEIKLREGVTFWDGSPVDAAAVKASLERSMAKDVQARFKLRAAGIDVVDPATLVVRTESPNASFVAALVWRSCVIHSARAAQAVGDEAFARQPVMSGTFRPVDYKKDELLTVVRHDGYWGGKAFLPGYQVKYVTDAQTRVLALMSGDADLILDVPGESIPSLEKHPGVRVPQTVSDVQNFLVVNPRVPPMDDARVRRAVSLGIDRKPIVEQVLAGVADVTGDVYSPVNTFALKNAYPMDRARAARLLDEAGWQRGADGLRSKGGRPLAFTQAYFPQRPELLPMSVAIQAQLKELGMRVEIKQIEWSQQIMLSNEWATMGYYNGTADGGDPQSLLDTFFRPEGGQYYGFTHPDLLGLIDQIQTTVDRDKRFQLVRRVQDLFVEQVPIVPIAVRRLRIAVNERPLKNVRAYPSGQILIDTNFGK